MSKQKIEVEVDVPDGWEFLTTRLDRQHNTMTSEWDGTKQVRELLEVCPTLVLRKVEPKRESRWVNVHNKSTLGYPRVVKSECDFHEHPKGRAGLIRLDFADDDLVAVTIEPV